MTAPTQATEPLACTGCGSRQTDAELIAAREANPALIACCPERDMQPETASLQTTRPDAWEAWKAELLIIADAAGWPRAHVETEAYRAYFDDGYTARDAWDEDQQYAL